MPCMNRTMSKLSLLRCITNIQSKAILMGRDKAFSGFYSPMVVSYWSGLSGVLEYTEHSPHYMESSLPNPSKHLFHSF